MDLGFYLGDGVFKSFFELAGSSHSTDTPILDDLLSWDEPSALGPLYSSRTTTSAAAATNMTSLEGSSLFENLSDSSSPASHSSSPPSSFMMLADCDESGTFFDDDTLTAAMPSSESLSGLGLSSFDLHPGSMDMPSSSSLGLYGLGSLSASLPTSQQDHYQLHHNHHHHHHRFMAPPHRRSAAPSGGGGGSSSGPFLSVKLEPGSGEDHYAAAAAGGGGGGGGRPPPLGRVGEPLRRKRKLCSGSRPRLGSGSDFKEQAGSFLPSRMAKGHGASPGDVYELPLAAELAGALGVGQHHTGLIKQEEQRHRQQEKQQQKQQNNNPRTRKLLQGGAPPPPPPHPSLHQKQNSGALSRESVALVVERQPPVEVRTRTPSENRNFGVTVRITGCYEALHIHSVEVRLAYASSHEEVGQQILGGKKIVPLNEEGWVAFDSLSMREASTKHGEREFCLEFLPLTKDGQPLGSFGTRTTSFYAYSHMKVLARRKSVKLRTLNKSHGSVHGGDKMHVIGMPFIKGPSLSIIFSTPHGDVNALNLEMYSDSVLFFESPPYPQPSIFSPYNHGPVREVKVMVQVTNDGRTMSNPLEFTYIADKPVHRADF